MDRAAHVPAVVLGIWGAGRAYVPLDPAAPLARQEYVLADSGAQIVVTDRIVPDVEAPVGTAGPYTIARRRAEGSPVSLPGDAAYVLYTSGSTGQPKGCVIGHGQLLSMADAAQRVFALDPGDRWTLFHALTFDASVLETWAALLHGGSLVVVSRETTLEPARFLRVLDEQRVTTLVQVPSSFTRLVRQATRTGTRLPHLRRLFLGGEAFLADDVRTWWDVAPDARITNLYGPTETTIFVTYCDLTEGNLPASGSSTTPIGIPLPGVDVALRDEQGRIPDVNVPGEMWVAGPIVGYGYLNRPDLTAERFVEEDSPAGRVRYYRTGDWATRDADGGLHFVGRRDDQVKLRGFRIELGEVEAALRQVSGVQAAACAVTRTSAGAAQLVACVVAEKAVDALPDVRRELAAVLPAHMIPQRVAWVSQLPLAPTGKLDRSALQGLVAPPVAQ
jgi:amino acid adenylation domain-containing protein